MSYSLEILEVIHSGELPVSMPPTFWQRPALLALSKLEGPNDPPCEDRIIDPINDKLKEFENHG
jgi:hypothetical protein